MFLYIHKYLLTYLFVFVCVCVRSVNTYRGQKMAPGILITLAPIAMRQHLTEHPHHSAPVAMRQRLTTCLLSNHSTN